METPRRPGQRPARLPPQSQPQPLHPLTPVNETSSGSTPSSHRRQHSPYYFPHYPQLHPPYYPPYHYPFPLYPYMPPMPPQPLYPLPPQPPYGHRRAGSTSREPAQRYRERENRTSSSSSRPNPRTHHLVNCTDHDNDTIIESPDIRLHDILKASQAQSQLLVWLITHPPKLAQIRRSEAHHSPVESLGASLLSQPATDPPIHRMRLVSNDFTWGIPIEARPPNFITIEMILCVIYTALHLPIKPAEWDAIEEPHVKRSAHWTRCSRLAKGESHLCFSETKSAIQRIDLLGDKVAFKGLAPLNSGNGMEFLLRLGSSTQPNDKRNRMRRGSF